MSLLDMVDALTGCFIAKPRSDIEITMSADDAPPPPPRLVEESFAECNPKGAAWRQDLSSACTCYTTDDGVGTYDDFVSARVSPYPRGDAPVELNDNGAESRANTVAMIDAEVVQACRKGDVAELERLGLTMDLEAVDVLGYSAVRCAVSREACVFR